MIPTHTLPATDVVSLATGLGGATLVRRLWNGQYSRRLRWIWQVVDSATGPGVATARRAVVAAADHAPDAVRDLLTQPMVGAWAATTLRRRAAPGPEQLGALAISMARCANTSAEGVTAAEDGWVLLPGTGVIRATSAHPRLTTDGGRLWADGRAITRGETWRYARRLDVPGAPPLGVLVEDCDPHRDVFHVPATGRLSGSELARWEGELGRAWQLLSRYAPARAEELTVGLHSIVPLSKQQPETARSATSTTTVGVIGLDLPAGPADLAITLVHEFQHSKLAALHDIVPLHHPSSDAVHRVPWRADARPMSGAIQGVYAFLGVADTWRALRAEPALAEVAELRFAETLAFLRDPARQIAASPLLTPTGRRFAEGVVAAVEALQAVTVSAAARQAAERSLAAHRAQWV